MLHLESKTVTVNKSAEELFDQLRDFKNFNQLMPDSVQKFEADDNSFMFQMKGLPEVRVMVDEEVKPDHIKLRSASSKLNFTMACHIEPQTDNTCQAHFVFDGDFNMMMRMMVEKPLKNFLENLADKLTGI
ncbi:MAG TPA: orotate phosphoribosyltransferase [Cryomorphaceae bacterium]|nr:orotate phosphoribosyltransferase [Owenweeksia sp.]HAD96108.1 orotate phosphoribosyltransferase [Cryomorphaceae bacterium]HCQ16387.1 orotate phosphoribosyltransferase [Cryomorphaceae bacterium]|tara:strand:+ start:211 stop:603 length:393 start_codon:yes stop_codon:yes gene_type:complete